MNTVSTFYLSRILGIKFSLANTKINGKLIDLIVDTSFIRPKVIGAKVKVANKFQILDFAHFLIFKEKGNYVIECSNAIDIEPVKENTLYLSKNILDKQIVDIDGRKLVRVNDIRLAVLSSGIYIVAVDVGLEGLLRRLGVAKPINSTLRPFGKNIPSKLILWDEVEHIDPLHSGIKLSKTYSKLSTLHPSDLADIIEDLDHKTQVAVFESLEEEYAADVLEELETDAQINVLESLPLEKAADVLEKMPADEVADILDEMEKEKAEQLLGEMESEDSQEVRDLMEYPENTVGSLMSTDFISFNENMTVEDTINELRKLKPEQDTIYYLYVLDNDEKLIASVSIRDLIISNPETKLHEIMKHKVVKVGDYDKIDSLAEIISKYNLLAIPVVDEKMKMVGVVIIDDVVFTLLKTRKKKNG
ncbi:MAG: CBS domain-containing protein [Bacteroidota bacterium]|nr:CBS domain-containing protein [Bacteroidota bacterium]